MATFSSRGSCVLCGKSFSKSGITRHLQSCRKKNTGEGGGSARRSGRKRRGFHLAVEGRDRPWYWLHIEIEANAPLWKLDSYLRHTWLECCGHMSTFVIDHRNHLFADSDIDLDPDDLDMRDSLRRVLRPGMTFFHEYDFGSTTELTLKVISEGDVAGNDAGTRLLARNLPPPIPCVNCESLATRICTECAWDGEGFHCEDCAKLHVVQSPDCDEMFLPVVNSPRMGECAYTGSDEDDWTGIGP